MATADAPTPRLTLFLRPPLALEARGVAGGCAAAHLDTLIPTPRFTVDAREDLDLPSALAALASGRAYATRNAAATVLAQLFVVAPLSPTSSLLVPWAQFIEFATAVTQTRIVLELPRKRGRGDDGTILREVPPAFAAAAAPVAPPRRRVALPLPPSAVGGENPHSSPIPVLASADRATASISPRIHPEEEEDEEPNSDDEDDEGLVAAAALAGWIDDGAASSSDADTVDTDSRSLDYPDEEEPGEVVEEQQQQTPEPSPAPASTAAAPPSPRRPTACSLCCEDDFGGAEPIARLGDAVAGETALVMPPCGEPSHAVCTDCLATFATSWHNHPIGPGSSYVVCPHDGCTATYETEHFRNVLTADDMSRLRARARRFGENVIVSCPSCGEVVPLARGALQDREEGLIVFTCPACVWKWCYTCFASLGPADDASSQDVVCTDCLNGVPGPGSLNRYFTRPGKALEDGLPPHMRGFELSVPLCVQQIVRMCTDPDLPEPCAGCGTMMHRASECNELSHCGIHRCFHCGMSGFTHESQLLDHYVNGGCPLYPDSPFWQSLGLPSLCDSSCQNDHHDCTRADHAERRKAQTMIRRIYHVRAALNSLHEPLRMHVMRALRGVPNTEVRETVAFVHVCLRG